MQLMFVPGLEHALSRLDTASLKECTRIGLHDDMTFVGSAARLNGACGELEATLARAGHGLRNCAPGYEQFEEWALPDAIRGLCMKLPRQRCGIELWGSAANAACTMQVGLEAGNTVPLQTTKRVDQALDTKTFFLNMTASTLTGRGCLPADVSAFTRP